MDHNDQVRTGVYVCHCGVNIAQTVDVQKVSEYAAKQADVVVARDYKFMCSDPGQQMIQDDIKSHGLNRVVVAACSPQMHELTFRRACETGGINRYLFQMANIREHCAWIHSDRGAATRKAMALVGAAVRRVAWHQPLEPRTVPVNPNALVVGAGIAGIQAALEMAESGIEVYLVERESTIGGKMAKFDKTFPTLDCSACILTPKMVSVSHRKNIHLMTLSEVSRVDGFVGNFTATIRTRARYVNSKCTSCGDCVKVCPVQVPNWFDEFHSKRTAIHKAFPQAVPNTYVIDKQERPPCKEACPIGQEAAGYVALIQQGKFEQAIRLIRLKNPLPVVCGRVCYHPCETECNRGFIDKPIAIQQLKRFATDWEIANFWQIEPPQPKKKNSERVAIVGAGPAGLTCAHDLALQGFQVTIFEALPVPGGMLAVGIPQYRLPKHLLNFEIEYIKRMGVEIRTSQRLGRDFALSDLSKWGYKAVFVATGSHKGIPLGVPGEHVEGVYQGIDYLRRVALGIHLPPMRHVAVIGGGNTAIDCARTALRRGVQEVTILYRRSRGEMPALPEEIADAEAEGVVLTYLTAPMSVLNLNGAVRGLECMRMELGEPDASGRRRPIPIPGTEFELEFDSILVAIGQTPDSDSLTRGAEKLEMSSGGMVHVNTETLATNLEGVFAGGDACLGPATVIAAMGMGKRAAESIGKYLRGEPLADFKTHMVQPGYRRGESFRPHSYAPLYKDLPRSPRMEMRKKDPRERIHDFREVELGFSEEEARREANRCLSCGVCVECLECVRVCEPEAVDHSMKDEVVKVDVGQILVATGYGIFDAAQMGQYGYGRLDDVYTGLEFERMLSSTGPSGGKILLRDGREPRTVAILHCIGSRDENYHRYCSRVCCMYALKFAHLVKDRTRAEVYNFYIDIRAFGKGYEEFYARVLDEGMNLIRGKAAEVVRAPHSLKEQGKMLVRCEDTLIGRFREIPVDMVVLCNAIEAPVDIDEVRHIFGLSRSPDGFFLERHPKLDPMATASDGIYVAGCAQGPKDIPDTVAQASGAAARMLATITKGVVEIDPFRAEIQEDYCSGCRVCNNLCPYNAIEFLEDQNVSKVNSALCKGCGTCVAACPAGAITGMGFSDKQIYAELEGILAV
jgi:heterodisulfide reductase subunit A